MARFIRPLVTAAILSSLAVAPASALTLPFGLGVSETRQSDAPDGVEEAPVLLAQSGDVGVRISQMENEVRRLTGKVEEMSFLVLQLQEQLRNAQADNDLRFQDLEGGSGGGGAPAPAGDQRSEAPAAGGSGDGDFALGLPNGGANAAPAQGDEIGQLLDTASLDRVQSSIPQPDAGMGSAAAAASAPSQTVASISPNGPGELYSLAYNYMLAGDYQLAEQSFRQFADTYPDSEDASDARYWLGESLFAQSKFRDAAEVFLTAQKEHPQSAKAPEMMLKLGMSLARLENRDTACVTYAEVERRYPSMSDNVRRKLAEEESAASCG